MEAVKSTVTVFEFGTVRVLVQEELGHVEDDNVDGLGIGWYVWPSAIKLATFIHHNQHLVAGKRVLELGAGTALPGLLAAKLGAAHVMLTDKDEVALRNARGAIKLNGIAPTTITLMPLAWGQDFGGGPVDVILAADCFYDPNDFEDFLATMAFTLHRNPHCVVYITYQLRSVHYTIAPYLARWNLQANEVHATNDQGNDNQVSVFVVEIRGRT
ncbi:hypothetical protein H310_00176 [Aphanomyces invadans]|uniref:Uncharacterized protein n=1 Tax=Aphanomyces invadans TaxID=157072 RepID=A0A024UUM6_9STRA|nr:hypothetical protein H310_00176 [Aphanomyces invadans]ETW09660.1 hypothetical protein H310_00176 [Aphanomyces invadans]|eukprot:XP_008861071.1 hypothetical protein H310_00176 [Aphanomyces invadans]